MSTLRILCLVFFIAAGALYNNLYATHSMGADLTYKCLGGNTYRLRLSFYRDCSGIAAPANVTINIQSASCGLSLTKRLYPIAGTGQEITPLCTSATSTCNGGTYTGITEWIYEGDVTLPAQCADWDFSYNLCCRNGAINTIVNPLNEQIYIHSTLNNLINPCNNSPVFMNKPVPFVCAGQQFCYNHGAYDSDGDSLAYSLINPLGTGGLPVTYIAPYSANQPINSVPAMTFDSLTGTFCATPQLIEVTVMAVLVKEYRNGVLIGQVERDMQITVTPCTNMLPQLTGINGTGSFNATICANQTYCFDIFSNDPDSGQQLNVTWDHSIPSGTLATAGSPHPVSTFCWTPTLADVSFTPHCFTVKIEDDACPYIGSQIFCYCLTVVNNIADAGPDKTVHCGGTATINGSGTTTNGTISYLWSNGVTTASQAVGPGTYILTVTNGSCQVSDTVNVILIPDVTAAFNASPVCVFSPTNFYDASTTLVGNITSWSWSFGDGSTSTIQNPTHQYAAAGTYNVRLIAFNNLGCMDTIFQTVTVLPQPVAGYMVNNACAGSAFNIINTSVASGIASYNWNFGNGLTSTLNTPPLSYPNAGTYLATLIVTDGNGCKDTSQQQITAFPIPNAAFTITGGGLCQGGNITVTDNSIGNINTWNWNFGNGQYSSQQNGAANYTLPGPYDITLIISSDKGCFDTITQQVNISMPFIATPVATQSVCPGASATLTASGGVTYLWSNGSTNASITVFTPGNTTYIVTVTDSKGCTDTTQANVIVNSAPVINITAPASFCYNQQAVLSASGASTYNWQPSGINGQSITVSPNLTTTYTVTGTDVNGCTSTSTHTLTVIALPSVTLTSPVICPGSTVALDAANPGSTYLWSSGQTTQSVAISTPGTYAVTVTNSSGCSASAQTNITASALIPNVQQLTVCAGISATFNAANPNCNYLWSNGNSNQQLTVTTGGTYTVTVTDVNGCTLSFASQLNVNPKPVINFSHSLACSNLPVSFANSTSISSGSVTLFEWDFGDGTYSTSNSPVHQYALPGNYSVKLKATSNLGCTDSLIFPLAINAPPVASFSAVNNCLGNPTQITNSSTSYPGSIFSWSFGNGAASTAIQPVISYTNPGNYTISLIVTEASGCTDTTSNSITIYNLPQVTITAPQAICAGQSATLTANGAAVYSWLPAGGSSQSISVAPILSTIYTVTGTDLNGCSATATTALTVNPLPVVTLASPVICPASSVTLNAGNSGSAYLWSTGQTTQSVAISTPGTYAVTVTNSSGCSASAQTNITASALMPNVQQLTVCAGISATFNAANPNCNYLWSNGNSNQQLIVTTAGIYTVTVSDVNGCTLSFASQLNVNPKPVINFSHSLACSNLPVSFANSTSISSGSVTLYEWDFGDGTYSTSNSPVHQYALPGNYFVKLKATSNLGCTDSLIVPLAINTPPVASFSAVNNCLGNPTQITNSSTSYPGSTFSWSFGNGAASTAIQPVISYTNPGNYTISLIVTEASGCTDTTSNSITIYNLPQVAITAPQAICDGQSATLTANGAAVYSWQPAGGSSQSISVMPILSTIYTVTGTDLNGCSATATTALTVNPLPVVTLASPVICPASSVTLNVGNSGSAYLWSTGETTQSVVIMQPGNYSVTVTDIHGCSASGQTTLQMSQLTGNTQYFTACNGTVTTLDAANSGCNFIWSNGATTQLLNITNTGTYTVTVTDSYGCTLSFSSQLLVNPKPVPAFAASNVCFNDTTSFTNSSTISGGNIISYQWDFGDGLTSVDISPSHVYALAGKYIARLIAISDSGCIADKIDTVEVYEKPISDFSAAQVCEGSSTNFINNSSIASGSINSYSWNFGDSSSVSTALSPTHLYAQFGTYQVSLITVSNYGCRDTSNKPISVNPNPVAGFTLNQQKGCGPLLVQFTDLSKIIIGTVNQWNWNFGDGTTSTLQNPAHTYNNPGTYNVSLTIHSDKGCSDVIVFNSAVTVYPNPVAAFEANTFETNILQDIHFENQSTGAINYDWNFGDGSLSNVTNPVHQYSTDGTYAITLIATNQYGCTSQARHEIIIVPIWTLYIPNAFTPDNDGVNDEFNLKGIGIENYNLRIFNRWGDLIFEGNNRGWDGTHMKYGRQCKQDVYVYKFAIHVNLGNDIERTGQVTLLK